MSLRSGKGRGRTAGGELPPVAPRQRTTTAIESTIGPNTHVKGTIQGDGGLRVEGIVEGTIELTGNLVVTESAKIRANIKANNISVAGAVQGDVTATRVEILETGRVWGDLTVKSLLINEGAYFRGQTLMPQDLKPPQLQGPTQATAGSGPDAGTVVDVKPSSK